MDKRIFIKVSGIVQGVGFRPFVYNLATSLELKGWVNNNSEGVYIDLQGHEDSLNKFTYNLKNNAPPLSYIENIEVEEKELLNYTDFNIKESERVEQSITLISPDVAMCADCKADIIDPNNRRYGYPFTNCTNCGPRFSIIKSIPYDRDKTTMKKFPMCKICNKEYTDPSNRRFHAQPNACNDCGPHIWIKDCQGNLIAEDSPHSREYTVIKLTQNLLRAGNIFSIKGLTGFNLCCDASNSKSVIELRERKRRPHKPFAVMMKDIDTIKKYCSVNEKEETLLTGIRKPIVLLDRISNYSLPDEVAPNQNTLGVMLPYTPLHELLFQNGLEVLIMTSANISGLPLEYKNESAIKNLRSISDYFLLHNRDIFVPVDDSVARVINHKEMLIRRARGYAPEPIIQSTEEGILCLGPNMKNTFSLSKSGYIFMSQHNGDLENLETYEHYKRNINHFKTIFSFEPKLLVHDMHPEYASTHFAEEFNIPKLEVQHHHAHIASCMAENKLNEMVIGISFDGTGYGTDGAIWGGEFLLCDFNNFKRLGHLSYVSMCGGEKSIKEPYRMAISYIYEALGFDTCHNIVEKLFEKNATELIKLIHKKINCVNNSSMGRFLDAAASIILDITNITYEGQASIELEAVIDKTCAACYNYEILESDENGATLYEISFSNTINELLHDKLSHTDKSIMAAKIHNTVINSSVDLCTRIGHITGIKKAVLSGGVFQNSYLLSNLSNALKKAGFEVFTHSKVPSNDGGVSLGQLLIADNYLKNNLKNL
jgi:hydrogenase maturation protein HypF